MPLVVMHCTQLSALQMGVAIGQFGSGMPLVVMHCAHLVPSHLGVGAAQLTHVEPHSLSVVQLWQVPALQ